MPKYNEGQFDEFMARAKARNSHFEKHKNSSLHTLIAILKDDGCSAKRINDELLNIPQAKVLKYREAIYYLLATYPGLVTGNVSWGPLKESNAALFPRTALPGNYDPASRDNARRIVKGVPPTDFLHQSCESFLMESARNGANNGVILIHLDNHQPPMNTTFNGYKVSEHINSVLRVAQVTGADLCVLHMQQEPPIAGIFRDAVDAFANDKRLWVYQPHGHMGSINNGFVDFASAHENCVVMGFDGTVCVHANIFGTNEHLATKPPRPAPPLITLTNVVTSRAVLVTAGQLYPVNWQKEYGVLEGLG